MKLLVVYMVCAVLHFVFFIWYNRKRLTKKGFINEWGDELSLPAFLLMNVVVSLFFWPLIAGVYLVCYVVKAGLIKRGKHDLGNS